MTPPNPPDPGTPMVVLEDAIDAARPEAMNGLADAAVPWPDAADADDEHAWWERWRTRAQEAEATLAAANADRERLRNALQDIARHQEVADGCTIANNIARAALADQAQP